jgi:hypothetical protein
MTKVERFTIQACCGKKQIIFKLGKPVAVTLLEGLKSNGFTEVAHFTKAGILYADNLDLIVTGPIGSDRLRVKCKKADCDQILNDFEALLLKLG